MKKGNLPISTWMLYRIRFIFTADLCGAWSSFGGIVAQFNNLSIILHLATTESISAALIYDGLLTAHLEELARARQERPAAQVDFADLLSTEQTRFKIQAVAQASKPAPLGGPPVLKKEKVLKEKQVPKDKPPGWIPKPEYLAKLAAEKKEAQVAANQASQKERNRAHSSHRSRPRTPKRREHFNRRARSNQREAMKRQRRRN